MAVEVALTNHLVFGSILNTILLTTDLLLIDLDRDAEDFFRTLRDETPMSVNRAFGSSPPQHNFEEGFNPELTTLDLESLPKDQLTYGEQAENAIEEVEYLLAHSGWKLSHNRGGATVKSLYYPKYSRSIMMLESRVDATPQELLQEFWLNGDNAPKWNSDITHSETLEDLNPSLTIGYKISGPLAGGSVSSRDFLLVTARKKIVDSYFIVYESTTHQKDPKNPDYVRATNGPSGFVFKPAYEDGKLMTDMVWLLNLDMHMPSIVPTAIVEKMLPLNMMKYMKQLKKHVEVMKSTNT